MHRVLLVYDKLPYPVITHKTVSSLSKFDGECKINVLLSPVFLLTVNFTVNSRTARLAKFRRTPE